MQSEAVDCSADVFTANADSGRKPNNIREVAKCKLTLSKPFFLLAQADFSGDGFAGYAVRPGKIYARSDGKNDRVLAHLFSYSLHVRICEVVRECYSRP